MVYTVLGFIIMGIASVIDIKKKEISIALIITAFGIGALSVVSKIYNGEWDAYYILMGILPGLVLIGVSILAKDTLGMGDGLMAVFMGAVFGVYVTIVGLFVAFFLASIVSLVLIVIKKLNKKSSIPFMPFLTSGFGFAFFMSNYIG